MLGSKMMGFQNFLDNGGTNMEFLLYYVMSQMCLVALGVFMMMGVNFLKGGFYRYEKAISFHEMVWTLLPTVILCSVAVPSMVILYNHEQDSVSSFSVKCTGHQWYWSYDYNEFEEVELDSFMTPTSDLEEGEVRFLETDNRAVLPCGSSVRFLISSEDVIHALTIPSWSFKVDATPGRFSVINIQPLFCGVFWGQCSELCGANHSFMPICVESTLPSLFSEWVNSL